ncbi:MAG: DinB family protein [Planctomycetota bacterium]
MTSRELDFIMQQLRRTPDVVRALLEGLPDDVCRTNYGAETFSAFDVVGHLIWGDLDDWVPRARHILEHGDAVPFVPFDRYVMYKRDHGKSMQELLDEFGVVRARVIAELASLQLDDAALQSRGMHPDLGGVTMRQLLETWAVHDLHHVAQICKALARQRSDAVGVWRAYLGILGA